MWGGGDKGGGIPSKFILSHPREAIQIKVLAKLKVWYRIRQSYRLAALKRTGGLVEDRVCVESDRPKACRAEASSSEALAFWVA